MTAAELSIWNGSTTMEHFADIRGVFHAAFPRRSLADHRDVLTRQAAAHGFMACVASVGGQVVAVAYGVPLQLGTVWWRDLEAHLSADFVWEDGLRTFAVLEVFVAPAFPPALGGQLLRSLLRQRRERRATTRSPAAVGSLPWRSCGTAETQMWVLALPL
ncbi:hypothetical protein LWF15_10030 [Kineosporia rhizophila]|uniref:hypothetical protein n=1 Tax=Kineosporia rhizophila TaxID=84633 RepID=UPI001E385765|nr:hypothetical protein [Kineosporia rhizophila]MCE0535850.1 hypothetical protein [Kineosporia rhizophila]